MAATAEMKLVFEARNGTQASFSHTHDIQPLVPFPVTLKRHSLPSCGSTVAAFDLWGAAAGAWLWLLGVAVAGRVLETVFAMFNLLPRESPQLRGLYDVRGRVIAFDVLAVIAALRWVQLHFRELRWVNHAVLPA